MRWNSTALRGAFVAVALIVAACTGGDDNGDNGPPPAAPPEATATPEVTATPAATPQPTAEPTATPTAEPTPAATATPAATPSPTVAAGAESVTIEASRDNTLYESGDAPDDQLSNGSGDSLFAGLTNAASARRALVWFDVASALPDGATIVGAELTLTVTRTISGAQPMRIHRVLSDWGEAGSDAPLNEGRGTDPEPGDATWMYAFFGTEQWETPGGDFAPDASGEASASGEGAVAWTSDGLAADVQVWIDDPGSNFGWIVLGNESGGASTKRFGSRENSSAGARPTLTVHYTTGG